MTSPRIVLRQPVAADRDVVIEMETDAEVRPPRQGSWVIALASSDQRVGVVVLDRRDPARSTPNSGY